MILLFAWASSPEYSASLHCDISQVHMHLSCLVVLDAKLSHCCANWPAVTHIINSPVLQLFIFAGVSSREYSASFHCDIWQVHMHQSFFGLAWKAFSPTVAICQWLQSMLSLHLCFTSMWHGNPRTWGWLYILALFELGLGVELVLFPDTQYDTHTVLQS